MKRTLTVVALACGLLAVVSPAPAATWAAGFEPEGSVARQVLLASTPGVPIAGTLSAAAVEAGFFQGAWLDTPAERLDAVVIPGLEPRNKLADTVHWLLGVATLIAGGVTGLTAGEAEGEDDDEGGGGGSSGSLHHTLGYTTAGLAAATLVSGFWAHRGDVGVSDGLSPANIHALLGITGGLMMVATPFVADLGGGDDGGGHAALGIGGGLLMGIAVAWPLVF